jgi:hypothetical protein
LIVCGVCGKKYIGGGASYSCVARHCWRQLFGKNGKRKRCTGLLQHRVTLDNSVWFWVQHNIDNPDQLSLELAEQAARQPKQDNTHEIAQLERALAKQAERRERAQDALIDGTLSKGDFDRQLLRIQAATGPRSEGWRRSALPRGMRRRWRSG